MDSDDELAKLEWAERCGLENLKSHLTSADIIAEEARSTLTMILAAIGVSFGYVVNDVNTRGVSSITIGLIAFTVYTILIGAWLVLKCMMLSDIPPPTNEPGNLYNNDLHYFDAKELELQNIQSAIYNTVKRNNSRANVLNRIRLAFIASPIVFLLVAAVAVV